MRLIWFSLLLPLVCSASTNQTEGDYEILARQVALQKPCPQDVHTVLKEMAATLTEQKVKISVLEKVKEEHVEKIKELEGLKAEIALLKQQLKVKQVAFSASLLAHGDAFFGPFNTFTTLVFKHDKTNIGNAYNPQTGIFTAPVRGVYHFELHIGAHGNHHASAASLMRNGELISTAWDHHQQAFLTASNGAVLLLEVGDQVYVRLWTNSRIYGHSYKAHNTFSGYLVFTM